MSHREALDSPGSSARRSRKHQQLGPKPSAEPDKLAVPDSNGKEKGRLVRSTSDFGQQDRASDDVKQKLPRTYSTGPQDGAQLVTRPAPSSSVAETRPPLKDEKGSLVLSSSPATSPSTSPPGTPLTTSGNGPNNELRKSSAMKRLSHAVTSRFGFGKTKPLKESLPSPPPEICRRTARIMSPSGLLRSSKIEEMRIDIPVMHEDEAKDELQEKPEGTCILHLSQDKEKTAGQLILSYKYIKRLFHHVYSFSTFKCTEENGNLMVRVGQKLLTRIFDLQTKFLPKFSQAIKEIARNINFVEKEMQAEDIMLAEELEYRRYIIYLAARGKDKQSELSEFVIRKLTLKKKIEETSFIVDTENGTFATSSQSVSGFATFNEFLLRFLEVEPTDKVAVVDALGYWTEDAGKLLRESSNVGSLSNISLPRMPSEDRMETGLGKEKGPGSLTSKERSGILEAINTALAQQQNENMMPGWISGIPSIKNLLDSVRNSTIEEKHDWLHRGILDPLITVVCQNGHNILNNKTIIDIFLNLAHNSPEISQILCAALFNHLETTFVHGSAQRQYILCGGIISSLSELIEKSSDTFRESFVRQAGVQRIVDVYNKASQMILSSQLVNAMGDVRIPSRPSLEIREADDEAASQGESPSPSPHSGTSAIRISVKLLAPDVASESLSSSHSMESLSNESSSVVGGSGSGIAGRSRGSSGNKHNLPQLMIPVSPLKKKSASVRSKGRLTASSGLAEEILREEKSRELASERAGQHNSDELGTLGQRLGETYAMREITGLLYYKRTSMRPKSPKALMMEREMSQNNIDVEKAPDQAVQNFRNSSYYKIKCYILKILAEVSKHSQFIGAMHDPANLLLSELLVSHRAPLMKTDHQFRKLIFDVLASWAERVEAIHRRHWTMVAPAGTLKRQEGFRRKLDLFLFRVHQRLSPLAGSAQLDRIDLLLNVLQDYMRSCPTRVMPHQVVDVCMDTLLRVKNQTHTSLILTTGKEKHEKLEKMVPVLMSTIHNLLSVFNEIVLQSHHAGLDEYLTQELLESENAQLFVRSFTQWVLGADNKDATSQIPYSQLKLYRHGIVRHYRALTELVLRRQASVEEEYKAECRETESGYFCTYCDKDVPKAVYGRHIVSEAHKVLKEAAKERALTTLAEHLDRLEFLFKPTGGIIMRTLSTGHTTVNFSLKKEMIELLLLIISAHGSPLTRNKAYADAYISFAFHNFVRLYHGPSDSSAVLESCKLYLKILLAYLRTDNEKKDRIRRKYKDLHLMKVLVNELRLEYEIQTRNVRRPQPAPAPKTAPPAQAKTPATKATLHSDKNRGPGPSPLKFGSTPTNAPADAGSESSSSSADSSDKPPVPKLKTFGLGLTEPLPPTAPSTASSSSRSGRPPIAALKLALPAAGGSPKKPSAPASAAADSSSASSASSSSRKVPPALKLALPASSPRAVDDSSASSATSSSSKKPKLKLALPAASPRVKDDSSSSASATDSYSSRRAPPGLKLALPSAVSTDTSLSSSSRKKVAKPIKLALTKDSPTASTHTSHDSTPKKKPAGFKLSIPSEALKTNQPGTVTKQMAPAAEVLKAASPRPSESNAHPSPVGGGLSELQNRLNEGAKFQVLAEKEKSSSQSAHEHNETPDATRQQVYLELRRGKKIYKDDELHITMLQLVFGLMLSPKGLLDSAYTDQFPLNSGKDNIPFYLHHHLNHAANASIIPPLLEAVRDMGRAHLRLLKLTSQRLFQPALYKDLTKIAMGAYGSVYKCRLEAEGIELAVKLMTLPKLLGDRCVLHDIFTEISILDEYKNDPRVSHLYDYGVDETYFWIIMKFYKCSLRSWRMRQTKPLSENLGVYLDVYMQVLQCSMFLVDNHINHYDIKCDNYLLEAGIDFLSGRPVTDEEFFNPSGSLPFRVCLADFGEAKIIANPKDETSGYTIRNRGTEFNKSPEMLNVAYASKKDRDTFDRRKKIGASTASDMWSLGCLFYELLTGEFLFHDADWVRFFIRVTSAGQELIPADKKAKIAQIPAVVDFLYYICTRDQFRRPQLPEVIKKFGVVRSQILGETVKAAPSSPESAAFKKEPPALLELEKELAEIEAKAANALLIADARYFDMNPSKITEHIFLGSFRAARDKDYLKRRLGITHVINCTTDSNPWPDHFAYHHVIMADDARQDIRNQLAGCITFIEEAVSQKGRVLIYSDRGTSRSAALTIAYIMFRQPATLHEAYVFVKDRRYIVDPNRSFRRQLSQWETSGQLEELRHAMQRGPSSPRALYSRSAYL